MCACKCGMSPQWSNYSGTFLSSISFAVLGVLSFRGSYVPVCFLAFIFLGSYLPALKLRSLFVLFLSLWKIHQKLAYCVV